MVALFDIVPFKGSIDDLPKSRLPFYVAAEQKLYLSKQTALGRCIIPQKTIPTQIKPMTKEWENGYFDYTAPKVPKEIMAQAVDFFRKTFKKFGTEAEVLILLNEETKEFKLLPPYQYVTYSGVDSLFDQADIEDEWSIIGTMHSHCDFGAFHSGTDTGDASNFNGLHITVGNVDKADPEFASMVMINGITFTYDISIVADISDLTASSMHPNWFDYFKKPEEFYNIPFKTVTKEQVKKFVDNLLTPLVVVNNGNKSVSMQALVNDWDWYWDDSKKKENKNLSSWDKWNEKPSNADKSSQFGTRWSTLFGKGLPSDWFAGSQWDSKLTPEGFRQALEDHLEMLFEKAAEYDIYVDYDVLSMDQIREEEAVK